MIRWGNLFPQGVLSNQTDYKQITSKQIKNLAELKTSVTNHSTDANVMKYQNQGSNDDTSPNQKLVANSSPQRYQFKWE